MQFNIAGRVYTVRIAVKPPLKEGKEANAVINFSTRIIWISPAIDPSERLDPLLHELRHAWTHRRGALPTEYEEDAVDYETLTGPLIEAIDQQGGVRALEALAPQEMPAAATGNASGVMLPRVYECGCCSATVLPSAIEGNEPEPMDGVADLVRLRWLDCDSCGGLTYWMEACTPKGIPNGVQLSHSAGRLYGAEKTAWLRANRQAVPA